MYSYTTNMETIPLTGEPVGDKRLVGDLDCFICPANASRTQPPLPGPTHYVGIAGLGEDAAELPLSHPRAGFFGYDRKLKLDDLRAGGANTLAIAEVTEGGPWTAGGPATVRGVSDDTPCLGEGGQFAGMHNGGSFPWSKQVLTNVLFADASVRPLSATISPTVFRGLVAIGGNGEVGP
jgi:hypothetical protein